MKRLTTGLTRLLGSKYQVVTKLRKRVAEEHGEVGAYIGDVQGQSSATGQPLRPRQQTHSRHISTDHILMLQTSLSHYEYILSHCQPAYMSHLSVTFSIARGSTSSLVLALSCVTIGVLPAQMFIGESTREGHFGFVEADDFCVTGLFSMNVHIPTNLGPDHSTRRADGSLRPLNLFFIIMSVIFIIAMATLLLVRFWRWQAKQKSKKRGILRPHRQSMTWWARHWRDVRFRWRSMIHGSTI